MQKKTQNCKTTILSFVYKQNKGTKVYKLCCTEPVFSRGCYIIFLTSPRVVEFTSETVKQSCTTQRYVVS